MEQERYYFRVGLFVSCIITVAIFVLGWFSSHQGGKSYITYAIYFEGAVDGLSLGSPVKLKGIDVGQVQNIDFASYDDDLIRVLVDIVDTAPVRTDTVASIQLQGITGVSAISLENTQEKAGYLTKKEGQPYMVINSKQSSLEKVVTNIPELIEQFTKLSSQGQKFLSDKNVESFSSMLTELQGMAREGNVTMKQVPKMIEELTKLQSQGQKLLSDQNIKSISQTLADLKDVLAESKLAMQQMNNVLSESKTTMREVKMLTKTIRSDPSQILHGPKYKGYEVAP